VTSNQTLLQWLPKCGTVAMLWEATDDQKTQARSEDSEAIVRVAYQCRTNVTWAGETQALAGRTLEEAFALENLAWCQDIARKPLQLRIARSDNKDLARKSARWIIGCCRLIQASIEACLTWRGSSCGRFWRIVAKMLDATH
jgi:hypothetical protein